MEEEDPTSASSPLSSSLGSQTTETSTLFVFSCQHEGLSANWCIKFVPKRVWDPAPMTVILYSTTQSTHGKPHWHCRRSQYICREMSLSCSSVTCTFMSGGSDWCYVGITKPMRSNFFCL